jgi:3-isopropylmalate/(R)-2-methylmalate dehydratase large subunit
MGMTITEKILAAHAGEEKVKPGQLINARLDVVLGNDVTSPVAIKEFENLGIDQVFDPERIMLVPDHFTPNKDIKSAEQAKKIREFARKHKITNYFEVGRMGIEHCLLPEAGLVLPGDLIIGADSHTCTYGALGAFATGVGSTDMAAGMATGEAWFKVPSSIKFIFKGADFNPWVSGKDLILYAIGKIGVDGALYQSMEFTGEAISALSMDSRFSSVIFPALTAPTASNTEFKSNSLPWRRPVIMGPPLTKIDGKSKRAAAMSMPGTTLSQLGIKTKASKAWAMAITSIESAISSRLAKEYFMPW